VSRSIHENRAKKGIHPVDWVEIGRKRRVKRLIEEERRSLRPPGGAVPVQARTIPIHAEPLEEPFFLPGRVEDIQEVLLRLPQDCCLGVSRIELTTAMRYRRLEDVQLPPLPFGSLRRTVEAGILEPRPLGSFYMKTGRIRLHYWADLGALRLRPAERSNVLAMFLGVLVHEVAHAYDRAHRVKRGRWRMDDDRRDEAFAESLEAEWYRRIVVPYLTRRRRSTR
jgi:hypothetical protein